MLLAHYYKKLELLPFASCLKDVSYIYIFLACYHCLCHYNTASKSIDLSVFFYRKNCVETYNVFDFLREVVSKVPDYGHGHGHGHGNGQADATMDDRTISKRRLAPMLIFLSLYLHIVCLFFWD